MNAPEENRLHKRTDPVFIGPDNSVTRAGRVVLLSRDDFYQMCLSWNRHCFLCGKEFERIDGNKNFNKEHVVPDWVLRYFNITQETIHLPNMTTYEYSKYRIPCCEECNYGFLKKLEDNVSPIIKGGMKIVEQKLAEEPNWVINLYAWMAIIFFKMHYKDLSLKAEIKSPDQNNTIATRDRLAELYGLHIWFRSLMTGMITNQKAMGSFLLIGTKTGQKAEDNFDLSDNFPTRTMMLRLGDIGLIACFDDSTAVLSHQNHLIQDLKGNLSPKQLKELYARFVYSRLLVKELPTNRAFVDNGYVRFDVELPSLEFDEWKEMEFRYLLCKMEHLPDEVVMHIMSIEPSKMYSFLFDEDAKFRDVSFEETEFEVTGFSF
jgi:hypothetical protein